MVYAPAQAFLQKLGVSNELHNLPNQLVINNYLAPTSLLAIGPDRYTSEQIYYLNVTDTLNYIGLYYQVVLLDGNMKIKIPYPTTQETAPNPQTGYCSISGRVMYQPFEGGAVNLLQTSFNTARIPQTNTIASTQLGNDGVYVFANLNPGNYTIEASCFYTVESNVYFDYYARQYYRLITTYIPNWKQDITIKAGENLELHFSKDTARIKTEEKLIYLGSPYGPGPAPVPY